MPSAAGMAMSAEVPQTAAAAMVQELHDRQAAAYEAYGAGFLATESGRATCAGLFAVISVNVVLLAYVATAVFYGGEDEATDAQTKKDQ